MKKLTYAGIGSRETPEHILEIMEQAADDLSYRGWHLRSGGAKGADSAFANGAGVNKEIHLPWDGYNGLRAHRPQFIVPDPSAELIRIAADHHPVWNSLSPAVQNFMIRNTSIVLGEKYPDPTDPVDMIICWTPGGKAGGGTGHAIRLAKTFKIPVFDLAIPEDHWRVIEFVRSLEKVDA